MNLEKWRKAQEKWVKAQLRAYLCSEVDLQRIESEIEKLAGDISPGNTNYSYSPSKKTPRSSSSVVEFSTVKREKARKYFERKKEWILERAGTVETALNSLTELERSLIEKTYLSLDYPTDRKISKEMNLPIWKIDIYRRAALRSLYDVLFQYQKRENGERAGR